MGARTGLAVTLMVAALGVPAAAQDAKQPRCVVHADLARLDHALPRTSRRLAAGEPLKIVAIGSSSTSGAGASSPAANYPSRLAVELARHFRDAAIRIVNRGVAGERARHMLARFETGVFAEEPDLVLWQVGTNAVLNDKPLPPTARRIHTGVRQIRERGIDLVLIDPQFAPKVIRQRDAAAMVRLLGETAQEFRVGVFRRFELMRRWREVEGIPFPAFLSRDRLHMNDWSYACMAKLLAAAIAEAATRPLAAAQQAR